jgi:hypothetical protein
VSCGFRRDDWQPTGPPVTTPVPVYAVRVVARLVEVDTPTPTDRDDP